VPGDLAGEKGLVLEALQSVQDVETQLTARYTALDVAVNRANRRALEAGAAPSAPPAPAGVMIPPAAPAPWDGGR
jgi:hypothetical protein